MNEEMAGNPLMTIFDIMIASIFVLLFAFALTIFLSQLPQALLPAGWYANLVGIYVAFFGIWDKSLLFVILAFFGMDVIISYKFPDMAKAMINVMSMFLFGYLYVFVRGILLASVSQFQFAQILPNTASLLSNNYLGVVVFFTLVLCAALNFRRKPMPDYQFNHVDYGKMVDQNGWQTP